VSTFRARVTGGSTLRFRLAAPRDELDRLGRAPIGMRNHQLNRAAFCPGQLVAGGELDEEVVRTSLLATANYIGLTNSFSLMSSHASSGATTA
jgi:hypothetical protein